jgi:hypothetical protein
MKRELPELDQISVASPCPATWDSMEGDDRTRFCGQCRKHVYNFSDMTRSEITELVIAKEGKLCARFFRRPDGMLLTQDCPVGQLAMRQRLWRAVIGIAATLAAVTAGLWWGRMARGDSEDESSRTGIELVDNGPISRFTTWVTPQMVTGFVCFPLPQMLEQMEAATPEEPNHGN